MAGAGFLRKKVDERFRFLVSTVLGFSRKSLEEAEREVQKCGGSHLTFKPAEIVDYLELFEAALLHLSLSKEGLRRELDYELVRSPSGRFTLLLREGVGLKSLRMLDRVRELSQTKRIALRILAEWQVKGGLKPGDVDEALDIAYKVLRERSKAYYEACPKCGRTAPGRIWERINGETYKIYVRKLCCGYVVKKEISLRRAKASHKPS